MRRLRDNAGGEKRGNGTGVVAQFEILGRKTMPHGSAVGVLGANCTTPKNGVLSVSADDLGKSG